MIALTLAEVAEAVGGELTATSGSGGTRVVAGLPLRSRP